MKIDSDISFSLLRHLVLLLIQSPRIHLLHILTVRDLLLLPILRLFIVSEDLF